MQKEQHPAGNDEPTRIQALVFAAKAWAHRSRRALKDFASGPARLAKNAVDKTAPILAKSVSPLFSTSTGAEFALQAGKIQNLRKVAAHLNGLILPAGKVFSFWRNVPRPTAGRGFAPGRELREGCIIPSIGGGLCQLTNSLYDAALDAGFEIIERHAHSQKLPGSMAELGRDATVFWNYVDLRFRAPVDVQIEVRLSRWKLTVAFRKLAGETATVLTKSHVPAPAATVNPTEAESCETCGVTSCFRNPSATSLPQKSATAWLVDSFWPEHDAYISEHRNNADTLLLPLQSKRYGIGPYRWDANGFANTVHFPFFTARRSFESRKLAAQGPARQKALLRMDEELTALYERHIPYSALHLVVSQNLLPFLWNRGILGGRSFDVLMTRMPLASIESQLDAAAKRWPDARMLTDFRADPALVAAETDALAAADRWITPHSFVASLAKEKALRIPWILPNAAGRKSGRRIVFPASTLARKGAWELREVVRENLAPIALGGPAIESPEFWSGCNAVPVNRDNWLDDAAVVVLPAWVENQPRRLLSAVAAGIPVVATEACGLRGLPGVITVPQGNVDALSTAIEQVLSDHSESGSI
jgi:hypothetical protein